MSNKIFLISEMKNLRDILSGEEESRGVGNPSSRSISFWNMLHVFWILVVCAFSISVLLLIPRHNSIMLPEYWFEANFPAAMGMLLFTLRIVLDFFILTENQEVISISYFLKILFGLLFSWVATHCICYAYWSVYLSYNHPIPFLGLICYLAINLMSGVAILIFVYSGNNCKDNFRGKKKYVILYELRKIVVTFFTGLLRMIFRRLADSDAQCVVSILIPIVKWCNKSIVLKLVHKMVGTENEKANVLVGIGINVGYGLFVATQLANARNSTVFCIVAIDFLIQLKMSWRIIQLNKSIGVHDDPSLQTEKKKETAKLASAELCEGLTPLVYAISFAMAYYGPNSQLINHVGIGIWGAIAVQDVNRTFIVLFVMFAIDVMSVLLNALIIWISTKVNLFQEFCAFLNKYWYIMAIKLATLSYDYFFSNDINYGLDWTGKFCWTRGNATLSLNCTSTDLQ